jgi:hypothetical protein
MPPWPIRRSWPTSRGNALTLDWVRGEDVAKRWRGLCHAAGRGAAAKSMMAGK